MLGLELGVAVVLPGGGVEAPGAHEAAVDDRVGAAKVAAVRVAIGLGEVRDDQAGHRRAVARRGPHVDGDQVPARGQLRHIRWAT